MTNARAHLLSLIQGISASSRWFLLALLIFAPWVYGATRSWRKEWLSLGLQWLILLFLLGALLRFRWPRIHPVAAGCTLLLLAQGWLMMWNDRQFYLPLTSLFYLNTDSVAWLPGVVDEKWSRPQLLLITGLIGAFWVMADLAANPQWRMRVWNTVALTGVSIVLLGIAQHVSGARAIFWEWGRNDHTFFATYRYHANAGAFINLVLPFIMWRAYLAFLRSEYQVVRAFWIVASLMVFASGFLHVSRAASAITLVVTTLSLAGIVWDFVRKRWPHDTVLARLIPTIFVTILGASVLAWTFGIEKAVSKWTGTTDSILENKRYLTYDMIAQHVIPVSGWWGFGPGTFIITFPYFSKKFGDQIKGLWDYAHQDYLQTLVEWGWIGFALWAILIFGGLARGLRIALYSPSGPLDISFLRMASLIAAIGILLHSSIDFPLQIASLQLYAIVALGLIWSLPSPNGEAKPKLLVRKRRKKSS